MKTVIKEEIKLKERDYSILEDLQENDNQICDYLASMTYKSDNIRELFDIVVECYEESVNKELFNMGYVLYASGYAEEAVDLGLCDGKDIIDHLKRAHSLYIINLLRDNLKNIIENYAIKYINSNNFNITEDEFDEIDFSDIDEDSSLYDIEILVEEFIENKANDLLEEIKDDIKLTLIEKESKLKQEREELASDSYEENEEDISELEDKLELLLETIEDLDGCDISYLNLDRNDFRNVDMESVIRKAIKENISNIE